MIQGASHWLKKTLFLLFQVRLCLVQWRCNNCIDKKEWFDHVEGAKKGYKDAKITLVQIAKKGNDK